MYIHAFGGYHQTVADDHLEPLDSLCQQYCHKRFRRIDRFIQMALIGSGRCLADCTLAADTTLLMTSSLAAMANTVKVQQHMLDDGLAPKPAHFINTLSNSAGFYVASNLGLSAKNLFISRAQQSLEAGLQLAQQELVSAPQNAVLLGAVDECLVPLQEHRLRMKQSVDAKMAEGSHWLLLNAQQDDCIAQITDIALLHDLDSLEAWISHKPSTFFSLSLNDAQQQVPQTLTSAYPPADFNPGFYGVRSAGAIESFLSSPTNSGLISINADNWGRFHVFCVELKQN